MAHRAIEQTTTGPRFLVNLPVHAEWEEERTGQHVVVNGTTENVGPSGAMVMFDRLPAVGSRIRITVQGARGSHVETEAEVVRLVRDVQQPLASLSVVESQDEWRGRIYEPAGILESETNYEGDEDEGVHVN
jgi:hypothetical protein